MQPQAADLVGALNTSQSLRCSQMMMAKQCLLTGHGRLPKSGWSPDTLQKRNSRHSKMTKPTTNSWVIAVMKFWGSKQESTNNGHLWSSKTKHYYLLPKCGQLNKYPDWGQNVNRERIKYLIIWGEVTHDIKPWGKTFIAENVLANT